MTITFRLLLLLAGLFCLAHCSRTHRLSAAALNWIPYEGTETLVFQSNEGERDSIFLTGIEKNAVEGEQYIIQTGYEYLEVNARQAVRRPRSSLRGSVEDRREGLRYSIIDIRGSGDGPTVSFDLLAKDARFYGLPTESVRDIDARTPVKLTTRYGEYDDVYILKASASTAAAYSHLSNYVTRLYWSKSEGLVRYDKNEGESWELKRKYIPKKPRYPD